ncbi:hypothetical protein COB28_01850 [Candidatus Dependentiae bacterium]|nr:MAG: hypothetical protein COB28_01850 [Candidatus Dependentiae bacterium]
MKQNRTVKFVLFFLLILCTVSHDLVATFQINHIFHAPMRTRDFFHNDKTYTSGSFFFSHAKKGFNFNEKKVGILNLDGDYNLKVITQALDIYNNDLNNTAYINPLEKLDTNYLRRDAIYDTAATVQTYGINLSHEQRLFKDFLFCGVSLPILHLRTHNKTTFSAKKSDPFIVDIFNNDKTKWHNIEVARRDIHKELGLQGNLWSRTSAGDCEFHIALHKSWDYALMCKKIQLTCRFGAVAPTGIQRNDDYMSSVSFGNDGHWSIYNSLGIDIELKQNLTTGIFTSFVFPLGHNHKEKRIAVYEEPCYLSPLKKDLKIEPGILWSAAPYITFENLLQGANLHIKYTYMHHQKNKIAELDSDDLVKSYLQRIDGLFVDTEGIAQVKRSKKQNKWHEHYMTFEANYSPHLALKKWWYEPNFYALYNYPLGGRGAAQNYHFEFGMVLHF